MPSPRPDRALRRLVADLASTGTDDIAAVLAQLEPSQRQRIEALLMDYRGDRPATPVQVVAAAPLTSAPRLQDVSSWLATRLDEHAASNHGMTARAIIALREVAAEVQPEAVLTIAPIAPAPRSPRRDRLHDLFPNRRRPS